VGADPALADETGSSLDGEGEGEGERGLASTWQATSCDPIWAGKYREDNEGWGGTHGASTILQSKNTI